MAEDLAHVLPRRLVHTRVAQNQRAIVIDEPGLKRIQVREACDEAEAEQRANVDRSSRHAIWTSPLGRTGLRRRAVLARRPCGRPIRAAKRSRDADARTDRPSPVRLARADPPALAPSGTSLRTPPT